MTIALLTSDLMTQSKVAGALSAIQLDVQTASSVAAMLQIAADSSVAVIDLATRGFDVFELVTQLRSLPSPPKTIIAFGPHVQEAQLRAAVDAGCNAVFPRGQFYARTADILGEFHR